MNGSKMVLFVSGRCGTGCFYCPVSEEKKGKDVIYANEKRIGSDDEIVAEAVSMDATGTGITGGDPLMNIERTLRMIRMLKERFGKDHHIHLYTSSVDLEKTIALEAAGLDEIRFHPPLNVWNNIGTTDLGKIVSTVKMDVGIEVPAIPDLAPQLERLIPDVTSLGVKFININELEFSESNWEMISARQYEFKGDISSAVLGSEKLAKQMIKKFPGANIHFCSSSFKDSVQLRKRLIRMAEKNAKEYDVVTEDGTVLKGIIYADDLHAAAELLRNKYDVPDELMFIDAERKRMEIASWIVEEIASELPFKCYVVEEYPTADRLEVERMPL
jgi:pyruvate formate-lyase activating enzyme-like uncharacterized protein